MAIFKRVLSILLLSVLAVSATQSMRKPEDFNKTPDERQAVQKRDGGKVQIAYFTNWGIYSGYNFQPTDIVPDSLTHILYAFADTSPDTGEIKLTDGYADEQKHYPGDSWSETGNNLYGNLKQLYLLKLKKRDLKIILSIGGYTYSQSGHFNFVTDASKRATFVSSALTLIEDYGFDGIDIDFEYPTNVTAAGFADLTTEVRTALDGFASKKGDTVPYSLSLAVSAGEDKYSVLDVPKIDAALTFWNLMAYDYAGSWLTFADNQANLYNGERTNVSTDKAIKWYVANGATPQKISMGIPLYGHAFEQTQGLGQPYTGIGSGTVAPGIYSYKALPRPGAQVIENTTDVSSYSYDSTALELVSYDTPNIATLKAKYVQANNLAGSMFWDLSTDKTGADSLVQTTASVFGTLEQSQNHISYPNSKWDNIKNNMKSTTTA